MSKQFTFYKNLKLFHFNRTQNVKNELNFSEKTYNLSQNQHKKNVSKQFKNKFTFKKKKKI